MNLGWERWLFVTLALGLVVAGRIWVMRPIEAVAPAMPAPVQAARAPGSPVPAQAQAQVVPAALLEPGAPPLSGQVERLLASRDPQQAYGAYQLIAVCASFNDRQAFEIHDDKLGTNRGLTADERRHLATMCGSMTERERQARFDYLAIAVKAGVSGAALAFATEGPFGDPSALTTRPDDPLVKEWKLTATAQLTRAAEAGDLPALHVWGIQNLYGSDLAGTQPELGYGYLLAIGFIEADRAGSEVPSAYTDGSMLMNVMAAERGLTPQQRAAAVLAARRIADKAKAAQTKTQDRRKAAAPA